ncbi:hypothetical protein F3J45_02850 [Pantoea sp. Ap-967]|uniref:ABC transporter permease n=1 Tax=Pantoea sp. Ap-967 TaxID=2608362 RepID=UPI001421607E|nr:hypothetical protein [Pantoea sp. Ap-967]NIE73404.1 hypothetical protein [Pantoea sp. Ap-967]
MFDIDLSQLLLNFLSLSAFYGVFAVGLALVFGVMKTVNFAHGEFFMLGGYTLWLALTLFAGLPAWAVLLLALVVGPLVVGLLGSLLERMIFGPTAHDAFAGFIASLGLSYVLQAAAALTFGVVAKSLPTLLPGAVHLGGGVLTYQRLLIIASAVLLLAGLWYFLNRTAAGRSLRAASQDRTAAQLQGIDLRRVRLLTMAMGAGLAAVAGVLMASVINVGPYMGLEAIWKAFIVVIVGGLGSVPGAIVAALLFGLIDSVVNTLGLGQYLIIVDTLIMLLVLSFFPRGLLGREAPALEPGAGRQGGAGAIRLPGNSGQWLGALGVAAAVVYPFLSSAYYVGIGVLFLINVLLVISYRTVTTMGGWSFAHITMLAVGAYITALAQSYWGLSFWVALPLSGLGAALVALLIAYPVMRTRQFYFFLSTFAAGEAIRQCFIQFEQPFGGISGIAFLSPPGELFGIDFFNTVNYYLLVLALVLGCGAVLYRFNLGRTGRTIAAMAENENLASAIGAHAWALKTLAFCIGSCFAGIAGTLYAGYNGIVAPTDFTSQYMFKIIAAVIIGGHRTFWGPVLGLLVLTLLEELLRDMAQWVPMVWGLLLILTVLFIPRGLEGLLQRLLQATATSCVVAAPGKGGLNASRP